MNRVIKYVMSSLLSCGVVIGIYTPFMIIIIGLNQAQFLLWIIGSVPMSLLVSWPIIRLTLFLQARLMTGPVGGGR